MKDNEKIEYYYNLITKVCDYYHKGSISSPELVRWAIGVLINDDLDYLLTPSFILHMLKSYVCRWCGYELLVLRDPSERIMMIRDHMFSLDMFYYEYGATASVYENHVLSEYQKFKELHHDELIKSKYDFMRDFLLIAAAYIVANKIDPSMFSIYADKLFNDFDSKVEELKLQGLDLDSIAVNDCVVLDHRRESYKKLIECLANKFDDNPKEIR